MEHLSELINLESSSVVEDSIREPKVQCTCQNCEVCLRSIPWKCRQWEKFVSEQEGTQQGEIWPFHSNPEWLASNRWWNKKCKWTVQYSCNQRNIIFCQRLLQSLHATYWQRKGERQEEIQLIRSWSWGNKKKQDAEIKNVKSSAKDFDARMSRADQMLQSAYGFMEEVNKRMTKGLAERNLDEREAAQKIIQFAQEKQRKAQDELKIVYKEKRKVRFGEKATKKLKSSECMLWDILFFFSSYWTTVTELTKNSVSCLTPWQINKCQKEKEVLTEKSCLFSSYKVNQEL